MPKRTDIPMILAIGAALGLSAPARADDAPWSVGKTGITHTVDAVTLAYTTGEDGYHFRVTVTGCGGSEPWYMDEGLTTALPEPLHQAMGELLNNAHLNCKFDDSVDARLGAGFDEALNRFVPTDPPHVATVAGWTLSDTGSHPGDDSDRAVEMRKELAVASMVYRPSESGEGASISIRFKDCDGGGLDSGFEFGNPPEDHAKVVNGEVADAYSDLPKDCKAPIEPQATLMAGFPEALVTLEQWLKAKPFVFTDTPATSD